MLVRLKELSECCEYNSQVQCHLTCCHHNVSLLAGHYKGSLDTTKVQACPTKELLSVTSSLWTEKRSRKQKMILGTESVTEPIWCCRYVRISSCLQNQMLFAEARPRKSSSHHLHRSHRIKTPHRLTVNS